MREDHERAAGAGGRDAVRRRWDRRAATYDTTGVRAERWAIGDGRQWVCDQACGQTLEVAIGTGRNLALYGDVDLTGIDLSAAMLAVARRRALEIGRQVDLCEGSAEQLPFPDLTFDTIACTLAVCSVADRTRTLAEMFRVLRPGGRLLLLDHVEPRWLRGRPATLAVRCGFVLDRFERMRLGAIERLAAHRPV